MKVNPRKLAHILQRKIYSMKDFSKSDAVGSDRVVFNIKGNDYRLVAGFNFDFQFCYIKFIGTHEEYNKVNVKTIEFSS
jgi:mRNA interferase HigB